MSSFLSQLKRHSLPGEHSTIKPFEKTRRKSRVVIITNEDYPYNLSDSASTNAQNDRRTASESCALQSVAYNEYAQNHKRSSSIDESKSQLIDKDNDKNILDYAKKPEDSRLNSSNNSEKKTTIECLSNQATNTISVSDSSPPQKTNSSTSPLLSTAASPKTVHTAKLHAINNGAGAQSKNNNSQQGHTAVGMSQNTSINSHISSEILDMYRSSSSDTSSTLSNSRPTENEEFGTWHSHQERRNSDGRKVVLQSIKVCIKKFSYPFWLSLDIFFFFFCVINFIKTNFLFIYFFYFLFFICITRRPNLLHHHQNT